MQMLATAIPGQLITNQTIPNVTGLGTYSGAAYPSWPHTMDIYIPLNVAPVRCFILMGGAGDIKEHYAFLLKLTHTNPPTPTTCNWSLINWSNSMFIVVQGQRCGIAPAGPGTPGQPGGPGQIGVPSPTNPYINQTATFSDGSPVITCTNNFYLGQPVILTTTGTLPANIVVNTTYYVYAPTGTTFEITTVKNSAANVISAIGIGSGTITASTCINGADSSKPDGTTSWQNNYMNNGWPDIQGPPGCCSSTFNASISGTNMTVNSTSIGAVFIGMVITTGAAANTVVTGGSGTAWTVSISQTVASTGMTGVAGGFLYDLAKWIMPGGGSGYNISSLCLGGHSNGGFMTQRMWFEGPPLFNYYFSTSGPVGDFGVNDLVATANKNKPVWLQFGLNDIIIGVANQGTSSNLQNVSFTGTISGGTTLTVTGNSAAGTLYPGMLITGTGVVAGQQLASPFTGTGTGGNGTYALTVSQSNVGPVTMKAPFNNFFNTIFLEPQSEQSVQDLTFPALSTHVGPWVTLNSRVAGTSGETVVPFAVGEGLPRETNVAIGHLYTATYNSGKFVVRLLDQADHHLLLQEQCINASPGYSIIEAWMAFIGSLN
jgi:hypothetical protein